MKLTPLLRIALAIAAAASLVAGLTGGLARLGVVAPVGDMADMHGAIMASGFFGTLISLERAVADGRLAALLVPAVSAAGAVLLLAGCAEATAPLFLVAGLGLTLLTGLAAFKLPKLFTLLMTVAAALWPLGTAFWMTGRTLAEVGYVWLGFLILTVVAERIELSRLMRPTLAARALLVVLAALFAVALWLGQPWEGSALLSLSLAGIALWLLREDIALRTVRTHGFARFSALLLICGYLWLIVAAAGLWLLPPGETVHGHDAAIHAIAIGFILSMVFAHAPIILPAISGAPVRYVPILYLPAALLQLSIGLRIVFDAVEATDLLYIPAWLTIVAIAGYVGLLLGTMAVRAKPTTA